MNSTHTDSLNQSHSTQLSLSEVRARTKQAVTDAYRTGSSTLIEALPVAGKTYATFKVAAETGTAILYLSSRQYLYEQAEKYCETFELDYKLLPTPHRDCPSFKVVHGEKLAQDLTHAYKRGVSGPELHRRQELPCDDGNRCPYLRKLKFDPEAYPVLVGNPKHAYNDAYLRNRVVVKDEFSADEFEFTFPEPKPIIDRFLQRTQFPFDSYGEVIQKRNDSTAPVAGEALAWLQEYGTYQDTTGVIEDPYADYHTLAPALTFALLEGELGKLANEWERVQLGTVLEMYGIDRKTINPGCVCARNTNDDSMYLLNPPNFEIAEGFVGLDGTPTPEMWEPATGLSLTHTPVLCDDEKAAFISDVLNHTIIQTNDSLKPYQNARNVTPVRDTGLALVIRLREGEKPRWITSKKALATVYPSHANGELFDYVEAYRNFENILSYNGFKDTHLGVVCGSRHYGDEYIQKWGAYAGDVVKSNNERGTDKSYGEFGNLVHQHLKKKTLQDVLRFGRDTHPTTVYVNTSALPEWVPVQYAEIPVLNHNTRRVIRYLHEKGDIGASTRELATDLSLDQETARRTVKRLVEYGLAKEWNDAGHNDPNLYVLKADRI